MAQLTARREYDYKPRPNWVHMVGLLLVAVALHYSAPFLPPFVKSLAVGLSIGGVIGALLGLGFLAWNRLRCRNRIALADSAIVLPRSSWSSREIEIAYG